MKTKIKNLIYSVVVACIAGSMSIGANAQIYKGETAGAGGPVHAVFVAFTNQAKKAGVNIQVNAGQTLTKSMLKGGKGEIDFFSTVPSLIGAMKNQKGPYKDNAAATEAVKNIRSS